MRAPIGTRVDTNSINVRLGDTPLTGVIIDSYPALNGETIVRIQTIAQVGAYFDLQIKGYLYVEYDLDISPTAMGNYNLSDYVFYGVPNRTTVNN